MKRMIFTTVLMIALYSISFAGNVLARGKTLTPFGDYKIELADKVFHLKGEECKTFYISYENSPIMLTVAILNEKNCKRYIVLSDKLSVQYVCNPNYFGVEMLNKEFEKDGYFTSDSELNRSEYFHQKVLRIGVTTELEASKLIAAYFPFLVNTNEIIAEN